MAIDHRLDFAGIRESSQRPIPRLNLRRLLGECLCRPGRCGGVLVLVAAPTSDDLAGHGGHPAAHQLQGLALGIQRLERDRRVGRDAEAGRAVGVDRDLADHALDVPGAVHPHDAHRTAQVVVREVVREQPQRLDRASGNPLQPVTGVDVGDIHLGVAARQVDLGRNDRRRGRRAKRQRFEQRVVRQLLDQDHVVEHVHQVDAPQRLRSGLGRHEQVLVAQRVGMQEFRPTVQRQAVGNDRLDLPAEPGNPLDDAVGLAAAAGRVEDDQVKTIWPSGR